MIHIDLDFITDMMGQNKAMALELLQMFADHAKVDLLKLRELASQHDYEGIRKLSHKMKSSLLSLNFVETSGKMKDIEHLTKSNADWELVAAALEEVCADLEAILLAIENIQ